ncbi:hypothetical protein [Klebsiella pneumoniae]|uniref:hypothetical protein n=1 Tax=Klebsiella pneumoniae TaxID=573 RepID=UPI001C73A6EA|nr:hypothetical protein [Klebsiella pneumoniae]
MPLRITPSVAEQEGQQTETEATGAPQKHHYTLNQQVGSITNALDGGWLRITTETGIIGLLLFVMFLMRVKRLSPTMSLCVIAFCINMLMIDIYMSYKVMSMMLLLAGYYQKKKKTERALIRQESINRHDSAFVKS